MLRNCGVGINIKHNDKMVCYLLALSLWIVWSIYDMIGLLFIIPFSFCPCFKCWLLPACGHLTEDSQLISCLVWSCVKCVGLAG